MQNTSGQKPLVCRQKMSQRRLPSLKRCGYSSQSWRTVLRDWRSGRFIPRSLQLLDCGLAPQVLWPLVSAGPGRAFMPASPPFLSSLRVAERPACQTRPSRHEPWLSLGGVGLVVELPHGSRSEQRLHALALDPPDATDIHFFGSVAAIGVHRGYMKIATLRR